MSHHRVREPSSPPGHRAYGRTWEDIGLHGERDQRSDVRPFRWLLLNIVTGVQLVPSGRLSTSIITMTFGGTFPFLSIF